jgi:murein DD-endopeptidase MepM/ murein hydrolase activator NlpD
MRTLLVALLAPAALLAALVAAAWIWAGRAAGPAIDILEPVGTVGAAGRLDVAVEAPGGRIAGLEISFEQDGRATRLFSLASPGAAALQQETSERVRVTRRLARQDVPGLRAGDARVVVRAARPVLFGLRLAETVAAREVQVRLDPPRVTVVSTHHRVNHGGAEVVVYRVTPPDAASGVLAGDAEFPGYPAAGAHVDGVSLADPSLKVAFFALPFEQDLDTPILVFARDQGGNTARVPLEHRAFPAAFRRSRVELTDRFLTRVVPEVLGRAPDLGMSGGDPLQGFLAINRELRRRNADDIARLAANTSAEMRWRGTFRRLGGSKVEARFADHRTYVYRGREVDQQVHLGFDLAATAKTPVRASNRGVVVHAGHLGIYGETVIVDHGMGVQSLYAHLSSIAVRAGEAVESGQVVGRTGQTGLADGDHLHVTMLVAGRMVSPLEWWDPHWIEDRILRKLREAR